MMLHEFSFHDCDYFFPWRDSSRRIGAVSLGLGALLAAGGLSFLPGQGSPFPEPKAVVTEAAETPTEVCSDKNSTEQEVEASRTSQQRVSADAGGGEEFMVRVGEMEAAGVPRAPPKARYSYVIIGAGTTANAAVEAILQMQPDADILLLNEDTVSALHTDESCVRHLKAGESDEAEVPHVEKSRYFRSWDCIHHGEDHDLEYCRYHSRRRYVALENGA